VIAHLTGRVLNKDLQRIVVDVQGVGYEVHVPLSTFYAVGEPGAAVALHIHTHVREDALQLFGFSTPLEQQVFERLIGISGIGPKLAMSVLSGIEPADLVRAVRGGDVARLTAIPGVGRKTAERMVVELKDRFAKFADDASGPAAAPDTRGDLLSALANLGYPRPAAEKAVDKVLGAASDRPFETLLREALKALVR
jgi:Holliday junction DNA helicase RuvA